MSSLSTDELAVRKHLKMENKSASIEALTTKSHVGVWFNKKSNVGTPFESFSIVSDKDGTPSVMLWPPRSYFQQHVQPLPFALGANGLQIPKPDGMVRIVPLKQVADALLAIFGDHHEKCDNAAKSGSCKVSRLEPAVGLVPGSYSGTWTGSVVRWQSNWSTYQSEAPDLKYNGVSCVVTVYSDGKIFVAVEGSQPVEL